MPPAVRSNEVGVENDEGVVFFQRALHEKRDCPLRGVEVGIEVNSAGLLQVIHDEGGVTDAHAVILDERQLALGSLARIGCIHDLVVNACDAKPGFELAAKRTQVWYCEQAWKLEQLDRLMQGGVHELHPPQ